MNASPVFVAAVHVGKIAPLGPLRTPSGFRKHAVDKPVMAQTLGLTGDAQADLDVHGGPDKAIYAYSLSRYPMWAEEFPHLAEQLVGGSMGENLPIDGVDETGINIGDRIRVGGALLQVSQPRLPCFKLGLAFDEPRLIRAMTRNGFCGWYYRVVETGAIGAGDAHVVVDRPNPEWPVARFAAIIAARAMGAEVLREFVAMEGLAEDWQTRALRQLAAVRHAAPSALSTRSSR